MHCDNYYRLRMHDFQDSLVGAWIRCNNHKLNNAMMCGMHCVHAQDAHVCKSGLCLNRCHINTKSKCIQCHVI